MRSSSGARISSIQRKGSDAEEIQNGLDVLIGLGLSGRRVLGALVGWVGVVVTLLMQQQQQLPTLSRRGGTHGVFTTPRYMKAAPSRCVERRKHTSLRGSIPSFFFGGSSGEGERVSK